MANFHDNALLEQRLASVEIPKFFLVRQQFERSHITDIDAALRNSIGARGLAGRIAPKQRVAITAGSRQTANMPAILRALCAIVREQGAFPFIMPAMGSHGGATAQGQASLLAHYGITEESVGAPIVSSMEVREIGRTRDGTPVYCSQTACEADAIILCNRIKPHPGLVGSIQSGLVKMSVIGLGKQKGAETCHARGLDGMAERLAEMSALVLRQMPVCFGVGILENAYDQTATLHCIPAERIHAEEPALLQRAQAMMPAILPSALDVLIVDEVGKNISGVCADPAVTLRYLVEEKARAETRAAPRRFIMCDLTDESQGAASGIGQADIVTSRLYEKVDFPKTYLNAMTSTFLPNSRLPIVMRNDGYALRLAIKTCNTAGTGALRIVRIKNTLEVGHILVSEALLQETAADSRLGIEEGPFSLAFDEDGNLRPFMPCQ